MNKKFWTAAFTLTGTIVGAGILGLPYVFSQSGFLIGIFWLIILGAIILFVNLCLGEITIRTREKHQLTGYARQYLGKKGEIFMFISLMFGIYSALLAYIIGEGQSLSKILPGNINAFYLGIIFWLIMSLMLKEGLKGLKKTELWGVIAIIIIVAGIFIRFLPQVNPLNLTFISFSNFSAPVGIILFAFLGFEGIPEIRREIYGSEKIMKKAIIVGTLIPAILYAIFCFIFIGVLGKNISEIATLSFGPFLTLLGIFTMMTSYFVLAFSLKDVFDYDLKASKIINFLFVSIIPLILYISVTIFNLAEFSSVLGIGGVFSAGITGTLILIINKKAKTKSEKKPNYVMHLNVPIIIIISLIFLLGIILELF